ncbi:MAG TPA: glycosyltransferase [Acidobacteriota bacterium]|nr:glycosyltransferase [Acidobacteriota bacterium]
MDEQHSPDVAPPRVSVVIPSYRSGRTLGDVLAALHHELAGVAHEIVVADGAARGDATAAARPYPTVRVVERTERLSCGDARNSGAAAARGDRILFLDADCVPGPGWGRVLARLLDEAPAVISGVMANGTPRSWAGSLQYWAEFSRFVPSGRPGHRQFLPSFQLLIPREHLAALPPYAPDFILAEDIVFSAHVTRAGLPARFEPELVAAHRNKERLPDVLRHLYQLGFGSGRTRRLYPGLQKAAVRYVPFLAPALLAYSWAGLAWRMSTARPNPGWRTPVLLALAVPGLACWHAGFWVGLYFPRKTQWPYRRLMGISR